MKISFPHMGNLHIAMAGGLRSLGADVIVPPYNSKKSLSIGTRHSPESVCLPYKLILGNYIQAIELGAEGLIMIDSPGICRLGQYSSSTRNALSDLGYDVEFVNMNLYKGKLKELYNGFRKASGNSNPIDLIIAIQLILHKIDILDQLDKQLAYYRAREVEVGEADKNHRKGIKAIEQTLTLKDCKQAFNYAKNELSKTPIYAQKEVIHVDITGEIFVVLDSFSNLEVEKELGRLGVHVHRKINLSDWTKAFLIPQLLRFSETHEETAFRYAKGFLKRDIGGDAIESVGDVSCAGESKKDGVIHLLPFTCMPEIVSQNILPNIRNAKDIPVLSLILDEQMGKAGFVTRLEAFIDLAKRRKQSSKILISV